MSTTCEDETNLSEYVVPHVMPNLFKCNLFNKTFVLLFVSAGLGAEMFSNMSDGSAECEQSLLSDNQRDESEPGSKFRYSTFVHLHSAFLSVVER